MGNAQLTFALERADQAEVIALIDALDSFQTALYPLDSHHGVDIDVLLQPNALFAVARDGSLAIGCGAVLLHEGFGELKRMYVPPQQRGKGVGSGLLAFLESQALKRGCDILRLETGIHQPEARRLYVNAGYTCRDPFAGYVIDPNSVFMEKKLAGGIT
jgi:putative acetyltransferase